MRVYVNGQSIEVPDGSIINGTVVIGDTTLSEDQTKGNSMDREDEEMYQRMFDFCEYINVSIV